MIGWLPLFRFGRQVTITGEQAVFGSFHFWDRGYDILAKSPGCNDPWIRALRRVAGQLGERSRHAPEPGGFISLTLQDRTWMVVGPRPQGVDDRGRPGAIAFHALFFNPATARRVGYEPDRLREGFRSGWTEGTRLDQVRVTLSRPSRPFSKDEVTTSSEVAALLMEGQRVVIETPNPIDRLGALVWRQLPAQARRDLSMATMAFDDTGAFDLIGVSSVPRHVAENRQITVFRLNQEDHHTH